MNQMQSPPYGRPENAHNGLKSGSAGIISRFRQNFMRGGRKTKDFYKHLSKYLSKSIASLFVSLLFHPHGAIEPKSKIITSSYHHHNGTEKE